MTGKAFFVNCYLIFFCHGKKLRIVLARAIYTTNDYSDFGQNRVDTLYLMRVNESGPEGSWDIFYFYHLWFLVIHLNNTFYPIH